MPTSTASMRTSWAASEATRCGPATEPSGAPGKLAGEHPRDRLGVGVMLLVQDPRREHRDRVAREDRNPALQDHRACVRALIHEVHRAARLELARLERAALDVEARELREQRGVDVEDAPAMAR